MKQYNAIKARHPNALLLFRVGDFYETFGSDAVRVSKILGIVLTQRKNGAASNIELAGFPHHSLDVYLPKLVRAGERVAICDQLEDPKQTKTIVKRGVTELVTPGVSFNNNHLDQNKNNFLASLHFDERGVGASFIDVSTGEFYLGEGSEQYIAKLLSGFQPTEVLYERSKQKAFESITSEKVYTYCLDDWAFQGEFAYDLLTKQFGTQSLKGFGVDEMPLAIIAAGAGLHYLSESQHENLKHLTKVSRINNDQHLWMDQFTQRNLEVFAAPNNGRSLIDVMDQTVSPMGSRMLKNWLAFPSNDASKITERHSCVDFLKSSPQINEDLRALMKQIGDLERIISRLSVAKINPKELLQLSKSLMVIPQVVSLLTTEGNEPLSKLGHAFENCSEVAQLIKRTLSDDPPSNLAKGNVIGNGVDDELDDLRILAYSGKDYLVQLQERESKATGITSLKVGFNNVFGYYLEVTHAHKTKVPESWIRKQTLVNAERYITEELKEYEAKILGAEEKIGIIESRLYSELVERAQQHMGTIQGNAKLLSAVDIYTSFAESARRYNYCKPEITDDYGFIIENGRHPVIEQELSSDEQYVPNDVALNADDCQIIMLTGPNMSGKSALLRQTALIHLMAQVGSFVPADSAKLGLIDRLFTRVGASDNISQGESTFMVEMNETASILNNLSKRSLVLLDEIGRGTSTYDGISLAWSISEYLHEHGCRPRVLFATHYHELNQMSQSFERIQNYTIAIKESKNQILFLRKLIEGGSEHSFGIHVAKMAGMPPSLLKRANEVLTQLESSNRKSEASQALKHQAEQSMQMSIFQLDDPVLSQIKEELVNIDINSLTPVEALFKLNEIKKLLGRQE